MKVFTNKSSQTGFTIIELMIASSVFSVVLLLSTYGLLAIGRSYYKGVTISRTQETARIIVDDITDSIRFNGGPVVLKPSERMFCIGNRRYSFGLNEVKSSSNHYVLIADNPGACSGGISRNTQVDGNSSLNTSTNPSDLMNTRMRLTDFSVNKVNDQLYSVSVRVVSGEDNMMQNEGGKLMCKNDPASSQFCAVSELVTVVQKRI